MRHRNVQQENLNVPCGAGKSFPFEKWIDIPYRRSAAQRRPSRERNAGARAAAAAAYMYAV